MFLGAKKILVVDDEKELTEMLGSFLASWGRTSVVQANTVEFALEIMKEQKIDLVISDINMHNKTGYDLLDAIRKKDKKLPFIMISGQTNIYDDKKCSPGTFKSIFAFFEKPFKFGDLKAAVSEALAGSDLRKAS